MRLYKAISVLTWKRKDIACNQLIATSLFVLTNDLPPALGAEQRNRTTVVQHPVSTYIYMALIYRMTQTA